MDPPNLDDSSRFSMEGPSKISLGLLEIYMVRAPDPQQKMSTESLCDLTYSRVSL